MPVSPHEILRVATALHFGQTQADDESCWRASAVRAYYALFHALRLALAGMRSSTGGVSADEYNLSHQTLKSHLSKYENNPVVERLTTVFVETQTLRYTADYDIHREVAKRRVGDALNDVGAEIRDLGKTVPHLRLHAPPPHEPVERGRRR